MAEPGDTFCGNLKCSMCHFGSFLRSPANVRSGPTTPAGAPDLVAGETAVHQIQQLAPLDEGGVFESSCVARAATRLNEPSPQQRLLPERDFAVGVLNARRPPLALVAHGAAEPLECVRRDGGMPGERLVGVLECRVLDAAVAHDAPVHALAAGHDDLLELIPARQSGLALLLGSGSGEEHFAENVRW